MAILIARYGFEYVLIVSDSFYKHLYKKKQESLFLNRVILHLLF